MLIREHTKPDDVTKTISKVISYRNPALVEYEELANELIARG